MYLFAISNIDNPAFAGLRFAHGGSAACAGSVGLGGFPQSHLSQRNKRRNAQQSDGKHENRHEDFDQAKAGAARGLGIRDED